MKNKIILGVFAAIIVFAVAGLYVSFSGSGKIIKGLGDSLKKMETEVAVAQQRTAPFVQTGEPVGYVIEFENGIRFFVNGDTGLSADMQVMGDYYRPDVAILPIGNIYTMDPKAAAYAAKLVNPKSYVIPGHYDSFPSLDQDPQAFAAEVEKYNLNADTLILEVGKERNVLGIKTTWLGHGAWLFETPAGKKIMVDPEVSYNPSFPAELKDLTKFGRIDLIVITHGHFDHMTVPDLKNWVSNYQPVIIAGFEAGIWLKEALSYTDVMAVNKGAHLTTTEMINMGITKEKAEKLAGIAVNVTPASHSSSATPEASPAKY